MNSNLPQIFRLSSSSTFHVKQTMQITSCLVGTNTPFYFFPCKWRETGGCSNFTRTPPYSRPIFWLQHHPSHHLDTQANYTLRGASFPLNLQQATRRPVSRLFLIPTAGTNQVPIVVGQPILFFSMTKLRTGYFTNQPYT